MYESCQGPLPQGQPSKMKYYTLCCRHRADYLRHQEAKKALARSYYEADDDHGHITQVKLKKPDTAWNPIHPDRPPRGTGTWIYRRFPDGGVVSSKLN